MSDLKNTRDNWEYYIIIKQSMQSEGITILKVYAPITAKCL